jgi:hypothetical protein
VTQAVANEQLRHTLRQLDDVELHLHDEIVLETAYQEAEENLKDGYEIETRSGERRRCADYCQVNQFCSQYQQYLQEQV